MKPQIIQFNSNKLIGLLCINEHREGFLHYIILDQKSTKLKYHALFNDIELLNKINKSTKDYCKANSYKLVQY